MPNSFTKFYLDHKHEVYITALKLCMDTELAKDVCQEVFIKIWKRRDDLKMVDSVSNYLFILTRNLVRDHFRQQQREQINKQALLEHYRQCWPPPERNTFDEKVYEQLYRDAVNNLSAQQRLVFTMAKEKDLGRTKISRRLGINEDTVRNHMHRAKRNLYCYLNQRMSIPKRV